MDKWLKGLWNNNKILFFILIPLVILVFFKDLILDLLIGNARKVANEAKKKDEELKNEEDKINNEANRIKTEADRIEDDINKTEVDEDWHKNQ